MISEKLIEITKYYTEKNMTKDELESFCNQYDVIFSNFKDELEKEVSKLKYELLDDIFMVCDSYEPNEDIRKTEPYCINERELQAKVKDLLEKYLKL